MRWAIGLVAALLLAPLLIVDVPPLVDYPNHLARLFLLARGAADPMLAPMFTVQWGVIPNLAIDVIGPPLLRLLPVHAGGRVLLAIVLLLPFAGVLAMQRAVFGRVSPWALASALILPSGAFLLGFLNFVAGLGAAMLLAALWIARRPLLLTTLGMAALFFCHLMAVVFALVLIGSHQAARAWHARSIRPLLPLAPLAVPPALLYALAPLGAVTSPTEYLPLGAKLAQLLAPFTSYLLWLDLLTALSVAAYLLAAATARRLALPLGIGPALATLAALFAAAPYAFKGTQSLDTRFAFMAALLLFAGLRPAMGRPAITGFAALTLTRIAILAIAWWGWRADLADFRALIAEVPPGARVFVATAPRPPGPLARRLSNGIPTDTHLPALLLIERRAFWPLLFDEPTQQPLMLTPAFQALADQNGGAIDATTIRPAQLLGYDWIVTLGGSGIATLAPVSGR